MAVDRYDLLVKAPITGIALPDGVRDVDETFMREIDVMVDALLAEKGIAHHRLDPAGRDEWVEHARESMQRAAAWPSVPIRC